MVRSRGRRRPALVCSAEVIVCAGAITPALLQSGIGPRKLLDSLGIVCQLDAPGVGQHLQDHPVINGAFH